MSGGRPRAERGARARRRAVLALVALGALASARAGAQPRPATAAPRPGWLPRELQWSNATPAQQATAMATLERLEQWLLQVPGLARPDGFEILPQFSGGYRPLGPDEKPLPNALMRYAVGLMMFAPSRATAGEGSVCVSIVVNEQPPPATHTGAGGFQVYVEGDRGKPVPHATQVYGELWRQRGERSYASVLFAPRSLPRWTAVTREAFVNTLLFEHEGTGGAKLASEQAVFAKTPYQEWMEGAAQRKRERDEVIAQARQYQSAAEVEKLRRTLEAADREATEQLRNDDAATRERFAQARRDIAGYGVDLRAALAAMSPAERAMPTYVNNALTDAPRVSGYHLTDDAAPPAWRVLTPNWDFWRARRSPVEVRSIQVYFSLSMTCLQPAIQDAILDAFERLDWAPLRAMIEELR